MTGDTDREFNVETVAAALARLNRFHRMLFWADQYHGLNCAEIAARLHLSPRQVAWQMRIMIARFVLAAEDVERGQREKPGARAKRLLESLVWTIKLRPSRRLRRAPSPPPIS
jgi:hypothetical protein